MHKLAFSCSPSLVEQIVDACSSGETGARAAQAIIDQSILPGHVAGILPTLAKKEKSSNACILARPKEGDFEIVFRGRRGYEKKRRRKSKK